jgi:TrmH family RNA methyltransferase
MIYIVILEPAVAGNVGAIARVMSNFGFTKMVLINPHCDHLCDEAKNRAKHAQQILTDAEVCDFFVVDEYDYLIATTARLGTDYNIIRSPMTPDELGQKLKEIDTSKKIGLVIGREGQGMFNEEIEKCDFTVTIPSDSEYPTLNVSHAVAVLLYEIHKHLSDKNIISHITPIGKAEKDQIMKMHDEVLSGFQWGTKEKKETQQILWKKIIGKSMLTKREAYGVMGFLRKTLWMQQGKKDEEDDGKWVEVGEKKKVKKQGKKKSSTKAVKKGVGKSSKKGKR